MPKLISLILLLLTIGCVQAQAVYKTPSGQKYHTATCRYVKNVSHKITLAEAEEAGLQPCTKCFAAKDSVKKKNKADLSLGIKPGEAEGVTTSQQCKGMTKAKLRCKRMTRNVNGYCYQHEKK